MEIVVALLALAGFGYFLYRKLSPAKKPDTGGFGIKPVDTDGPDKV